MNRLAAFAPQILALQRIIVGLLFLEHGTSKLFGFPESPMPMPDPLPPMLLASAVLELVGGALLAVGLFTRITAFIVPGEMAVAYFMAHAPRGFFPLVNMGEPAILYCFIFLYLAAAGGGAWSLDSLRSKATPAP
ncbi:MAG: DoxX family protein [Rhodospirillaceae bacterium]|nr:DoxX family protein [Rhodospirillaceae bacterium]